MLPNPTQLLLSRFNEKEIIAAYRQADQFFVVSFHTSEDLLAIASEFVQLLLDDSCIQGLTLLYQLLPLANDLLDLIVVQRDLLLEGLRVQIQCEFYTAWNDVILKDMFLTPLERLHRGYLTYCIQRQTTDGAIVF